MRKTRFVAVIDSNQPFKRLARRQDFGVDDQVVPVELGLVFIAVVHFDRTFQLNMASFLTKWI